MKQHTTTTRPLLLLCVLAGLGAAPGCGGVNYQVVRQASPNPFVGSATFTLLPLDVSAMSIDGEPAASWLAHNPSDAATVPGDIQSASSHVTSTAVDHAHGAIVPQGGRFGVRARIVSWVRGHYAYFGAVQTHVTVDAQIVDPQGQVLDEVRFEREVSHPLFRPTPIQGLETALEEVGEDIGDYLSLRRSALLLRGRHLATASPSSGSHGI